MGAWSNSFADYKPKYFSRCHKSAKCKYFRKRATVFVRGASSSELILENILKLIIVIMMKNRKISRFYRMEEMDFQRLAGPRNVSIHLKYDVLCL